MFVSSANLNRHENKSFNQPNRKRWGTRLINIIKILPQALSGEVYYCTHTHAHTCTKAFRSYKSHMNIKLLTTRFYIITACVGSIYGPLLMLILNRWLLLIIKLKLRSWVFWFWKILILHRNQTGFLLSPVYKRLKGIITIHKEQNGHLIGENQQRISSIFSKQTC